MTQQYADRNINDPAGATLYTTTATNTNVNLTSGDVGTLVVFDTTAAAGTITLPRAADAGAGAEITIVCPVAAVGLEATIQAVPTLPPDALNVAAGGPTLVAAVAFSSWTVRSNGVKDWFLVSGTAA